MKPTANNSSLFTPGANQPDGLEISSIPSSAVLPRTKSSATARVEEIIGVTPMTARSLAQVPATDVKSDFHSELFARISDCESPADLQKTAAAVLLSHAGFDFVGWQTSAGTQIGTAAQFIGITAAVDSLSVKGQEAVREAASAATGNQTQLSQKCVGAVAVPVEPPGSFLIAFTDTCQAEGVSSAQRSAAELTAAKISQWHIQHQLRQSESDVRHVAAVVELVGRVAESADLDIATKRISEDLRDYLNGSRVYIGLCPTVRSACRLKAVSDTEIDSQSQVLQFAEAVLQESVARGATAAWPASDPENRHAMLSHQQFALDQKTDAIVSSPLRTSSGDAVGAIFVTFGGEQCDSLTLENAATFLNAAERSLASALRTLTRTSQSMAGQLLDGARRTFVGNRLKTVCAAVVAFFGAMMIPVDYRVECESELQPVSRRFVAAPFEAPLDECLVEPGDVVEANQLLATLDGRELRWELSGVRADLGKAGKEHNAFLSEQKSGEAAIARHEIERLQNKAALLTDRTKNLEIRSPIAGIVVAGDLKETEGVPLSTGQSMFEVAPLDRMVIEVGIPEEDIRHVHEDMPLSLVLDAMPSEPITATIVRIHPRAELREHENVFVAEAEIDNSERHLRPGMRGYADVSTGSRSLGWTLFHKPVAHVIGWLGW